MFSSLHILLKDNNITLHMMARRIYCVYDKKIPMCVFQTMVQLKHLTNDSTQTLFLKHKFFHFLKEAHYLSVAGTGDNLIA